MQKTPFQSEKDSQLIFPYQPVRDLVFIFPDPPPEKLGNKGLIHIPEPFRKKYHDGIGTILAIGSGYVDAKGRFRPVRSSLRPGVRVFFDITVPWGTKVLGQDGREYYVILCGVTDIFGIVN